MRATKIKVIVIVIVFLSIICLTSFVKTNAIDNNTNVTIEVNKNLNFYNSNLEKYNQEYLDTVKIETRADQETLDSINKILEEEYNKSAVYSSKGMRVGVIKINTCGDNGYTLTIRMNTEKSNNNDGGRFLNLVAFYLGSDGDCILPGVTYHGRYVSMSFCIVDGGYFERWEHDYALLKLSNYVPPQETGIEYFYRYHDNEDNVCVAHHGIWINGVQVDGNAYYGNSVTREGGANLCFYYFSKNLDNPSVRPFDFLDFPYAVFGRFGQKQGYLQIDDEDTDNNNSFWPNYGYNPYYNIFQGVDNTIYFFSVVGDYCGQEYLNN